MRQIRLKEFLFCDWKHDYYPDQKWMNFELIPMKSTRVKMKSFHIFGNLLTNEFHLSVDVERHENSLYDAVKGCGDLYFLIINNKPDFHTCTYLPQFDKSSEILYLSTGDFESLTQTEITVKKESVLGIKPVYFNVEVTSGDQLQIRDRFQKVILNLSPGSSIIDLTRLGEGYYELWRNGQFEEKFFALNEYLSGKEVGVLHIGEKEVLEMITADVNTCSVHFQVKRAFWEYEIAVSKTRKIEIKSIEIEALDGFDFVEQAARTLPDGTFTYVFRSAQLHDLVKFSQEHHELVVRYANLHAENVNEMVIKLPTPDPTRIFTEEKDSEPSMVAPTLVYV